MCPILTILAKVKLHTDYSITESVGSPHPSAASLPHESTLNHLLWAELYTPPKIHILKA